MADEEATIPTPPVEQEGQNSERRLYCTIDIWLVGFPSMKLFSVLLIKSLL